MMKNKISKSAVVLTTAASLLLPSFWAQPAAAETKTPAKAATKSTPSSWNLSGYLPESPEKKVYLTLEGTRITDISNTRPKSGFVLDSDSLIFPGLIDMHSHLKYNILPLWDQAVGQFNNRFEWRQHYSAYKNSVALNMKPIVGDTVCAAVRWSELKALAGGTTAVQGVGGDSRCAEGFGAHNIEIAGEFENAQRVRSINDIIIPGLMGTIFEPLIAPKMDQAKMSYDEAYKDMLKNQGVTAWVQEFVSTPRSLEAGLSLTVGPEVSEGLGSIPPSAEENPAAARAYFESIKPKLASLLAGSPYRIKATQTEKQIDNIESWIFGATTGAKAKSKSDGFLNSAPNEDKAYEYLSRGGCLRIPSAVRRYIGMFESSVRQSILSYLGAADAKGVVVHLAEGMRHDVYNRTEYQFTKKMGLNRPGMVLIHGVGMDRADFEDAAQQDISVVWSPFSNLLLYGETLDVESARAAGVNLAIGADWSPTGSKNLRGELKLAKRYLQKMGIKNISDQDLVNMATLNAAKAMRLSHIVGKVAAGYQADLTLISKAALSRAGGNPYSALIDAQAAEVSLTIVAGQPLFGDADKLLPIATALGDATAPEVVKSKNKKACGAEKAFRTFSKNMSELSTPSALESHLRAKLSDYAKSVVAGPNKKLARFLAPLDPLFACEDERYTKRFENFIEFEVEVNELKRAILRKQAKLNDDWNPMGQEDVESE
ncbi:amidohydrolase family protein [Bdellovibrionota bacterium FG-2]